MLSGSKSNFVKLIVVLAVLSCFSSLLYASGEYMGTRAAEFLNIGIGARPSSMGGAFSSVCDDVYAVYWNPAGLEQVRTRELAFSHAFWLEGISYDFLAYCQKVRGLGTIGVSTSWLLYGTLAGRDNSGAVTSDFNAGDFNAVFSYSTTLAEPLLFGVNVKYINQAIGQEIGSSFAADAGLLLRSYILEDLDLAFVVSNIGPELRISEANYPLPYHVKAGSSYKLLNKCLLVAADADIQTAEPIALHLGSEYLYDEMFAFRLGYNTENVGDLGLLAGFSFGIGFKYPFDGYMINIDYAFVPYGELIGTHRISTILRF